MSLVENTLVLDDLFAKSPLLPVISIQRESDILPLADALAAGGITTLEITLRTPLGMTAIALLRRERPGLWMGGSFSRYWMRARSLLLPQAVPTSC